MRSMIPMFVIHRSAPDLCFLSLHLTPEANIKCNRSQTYLNKPTQKSEGFPAVLPHMDFPWERKLRRSCFMCSVHAEQED